MEVQGNGNKMVTQRLQNLWKRGYQSGVTSSIKRVIIHAVIIGALLAGVFILKTAYTNHYSSEVSISFIYPDIAEGKYPDGKRFSMHDLLDSDRVSEALAAMQEKGLYKDITVPMILNNLSVANYLSDPVQEKVEDIRSLGNDFSYYSNEYVLSFRQPVRLDAKDASSLFGIFKRDMSGKFLSELVKANFEYISQMHTDDGDAFLNLAKMDELSTYDYAEVSNFYSMKTVSLLDYLYGKQEEANAYVATSTGLSFSDLFTAFQVFLDVDIQQYWSFVYASRLTGQLEQIINKKTTEIENNQLDHDKQADAADIARIAMETYDHTFTENLIIVAVNQVDGLYQARPKTAYDTVVQEMITASTEAMRYQVANEKLRQEIDEYKATQRNAEEYARLTAIAISMQNDLATRYDALVTPAAATVKEYLAYVNKSYFTSKGVTRALCSLTDVIKTLGVFVLSALAILLLSMTRLLTKVYMEERRHRDTIRSMTE